MRCYRISNKERKNRIAVEKYLYLRSNSIPYMTQWGASPPPSYDYIKKDILKGYDTKFFQVSRARQDENVSPIRSGKQWTSLSTFQTGFDRSPPHGGLKKQSMDIKGCMKKGTQVCVVRRERRYITRYTSYPHSVTVARYALEPSRHHLIWD